MSMFFPGEPLPPEMEKAVEELEQVMFKLGLYIQHVTMMTPQDERGPIQGADPMLVAHFTIGDNAFHARVQDPESEKFDTQFRGIAGEERDSDFERIQREARERMIEAGGDPLAAFGDDENEDEDDVRGS